MVQRQKNPAGSTTLPHRAGIVGKLECSQDIKTAPQYEAPAWPIRLLARRHGLTVAHAALVASLAFAAAALPGEFGR
jgi:hypothetical protein